MDNRYSAFKYWYDTTFWESYWSTITNTPEEKELLLKAFEAGADWVKKKCEEI